jgi:hypothetical protein
MPYGLLSDVVPEGKRPGKPTVCITTKKTFFGAFSRVNLKFESGEISLVVPENIEKLLATLH